MNLNDLTNHPESLSHAVTFRPPNRHRLRHHVQDEEVRLDQGRDRQHPPERQHAEPAHLRVRQLRPRLRGPLQAGTGRGE